MRRRREKVKRKTDEIDKERIGRRSLIDKSQSGVPSAPSDARALRRVVIGEGYVVPVESWFYQLRRFHWSVFGGLGDDHQCMFCARFCREEPVWVAV